MNKENMREVLEYLKQLPSLEDAMGMTDEELLGKLKKFDLHIDRPSFEILCADSISAEAITDMLIDKHCPSTISSDPEIDWIYISVVTLWERWLPGKPCCDHVNIKMDNGYSRLDENDKFGAYKSWSEAWQIASHLSERLGMRSAKQFEDLLNGTYLFDGWLSDFAELMYSMIPIDKQYRQTRSSFLKDVGRRFGPKQKARASKPARPR